MQGFLNLNKPVGFTSHDCVAKLRKLLRLKRIGHGGTLDPAATGVLPMALGKATRLLQYLSHQKAYRARIRFGITTSTDDLEGEILTQQAAAGLTLAEIQSALPQFMGTIDQIPPSYSAIQVGGKRLYELARAGQLVEAPLRQVEVQQIQILDWHPGEFPELELAITCGGGTYIRSIARDLGAVLETGGTLTGLIRTQSSSFHLAESLTLEELAEQLETGCFRPIPPAVALPHLPMIRLLEAQTVKWRQGQRLNWSELLEANPQLDFETLSQTPAQVERIDGEYLGIGQAAALETGELALIPKLVWD
ncbi:MAG: tRNA pseudouridine(55) synthase TruB [Pegethrix bostrychoides GSE-TBD4-15B]|uniref:tRNA pseudouridine synthase B n=1 Tax=Pegethrix bostrychoides GSE-TBD4-15B TaxID=2839662 RepID=A0A951PAE4_9CYAN|nr:tRNA pseudouridine(55) synthase TruB [Pegethrix bostrychoides GSE-TBD4-15B]